MGRKKKVILTAAEEREVLVNKIASLEEELKAAKQALKDFDKLAKEKEKEAVYAIIEEKGITAEQLKELFAK